MSGLSTFAAEHLYSCYSSKHYLALRVQGNSPPVLHTTKMGSVKERQCRNSILPGFQSFVQIEKRFFKSPKETLS